jgi:cathepsin L
LKGAIATQPIVVNVDSGQDVFKMYHGGIISDVKACGNLTDEPLLAVGYGKDEKTGAEYYLVKNNFGTDWGEDGYVRIGIVDGAGVCGIQTNPYYAETS